MVHIIPCARAMTQLYEQHEELDRLYGCRVANRSEDCIPSFAQRWPTYSIVVELSSRNEYNVDP